MPYGFGLYYDPTMILMIPALIFALWAQFKVKSTFERFSRVSNSRGLTASQVARQILDDNGLYNVKIERISGHLSDHFDPRTNVVRLSDSVYGSSSVASIGVAAHEVGHAIQYATNYKPIKVRSSLVPVTNIGSTLGIWLVIIGMFISTTLAVVGVVLFATVVLFQLVTLPVEFNASSRALATLESQNILYGDELVGAKKVLSAAAMTYVAALVSSLATLLRLVINIMLSSRRRDD
jgi:Zn-dependent membrane protease YugP